VDRDEIQSRLDRELHSHGARLKDADQWKVRQDVFDEATLIALYRLANKKIISSIGGALSTGKEANIFLGEKDGQLIVIKIYMIRTANFKAMTDYLDGDPRFANVRRIKKEIIFAWTRKEYSNLMRAQEAGIAVPKPLAFNRNILLMEFLGKDEKPYPQLRLAMMEDAEKIYHLILEYMEILCKKARLIHADLSEYNILLGDRPYLIDMGQSVTLDHPRAMQFLIRDIANVNRFFKSYCDTIADKELFGKITEGIIQEP